MLNNKIDNTFVQIIPEKMKIENYTSNKLNKILTFINNCNITLNIYLTPSDSNLITLTETSIRISPKSKKEISFSITDNLFKSFSKNKILIKPKKLHIYIKNDLIEEKVEILLLYYCRKNNFEFKNYNIDDNFNFNYNDNILLSDDINNTDIFPRNFQNRNFIYNNIQNYNDININNFYDEEELYDKNDYINKILNLNKILKKSKSIIKQLQMQKNNFRGKLRKQKIGYIYIKSDINKEQNYKMENEILKAKINKLNNMVINLENKLMKYKQELNRQKNNNI